jgi:hypothetical protein
MPPLSAVFSGHFFRKINRIVSFWEAVGGPFAHILTYSSWLYLTSLKRDINLAQGTLGVDPLPNNPSPLFVSGIYFFPECILSISLVYFRGNIDLHFDI